MEELSIAYHKVKLVSIRDMPVISQHISLGREPPHLHTVRLVQMLIGILCDSSLAQLHKISFIHSCVSSLTFSHFNGIFNLLRQPAVQIPNSSPQPIQSAGGHEFLCGRQRLVQCNFLGLLIEAA